MTILEKVNEQLAEIKPKTVYGDLSRCSKIVGITKEVICVYSNGKGRNPNTAIKILNGLKKIVEQREKSIA